MVFPDARSHETASVSHSSASLRHDLKPQVEICSTPFGFLMTDLLVCFLVLVGCRLNFS